MQTLFTFMALCEGNPPMDSPHKGSVMQSFFFLSAWISCWINCWIASDLRRCEAHVIPLRYSTINKKYKSIWMEFPDSGNVYSTYMHFRFVYIYVTFTSQNNLSTQAIAMLNGKPNFTTNHVWIKIKLLRNSEHSHSTTCCVLSVAGTLAREQDIGMWVRGIIKRNSSDYTVSDSLCFLYFGWERMRRIPMSIYCRYVFLFCLYIGRSFFLNSSQNVIIILTYWPLGDLDESNI